jgi:hypothetical protein
VHLFFEAKPQKTNAPRKVLFFNDGAKRPMLREYFNGLLSISSSIKTQ